MITRAKLWWKVACSGQKKTIFASLAAHSGQISVGLGQGFSAILVPKLLTSHLANADQTSWIAALGVVSNPLGSLIAGLCAEWFGRRSAIALASLPHVAGWLLIALAKNLPLLYVGRFVSGIGMGMANGLYLYVSEAAAPNQRAWLGSCGPVLVSLGVLMIYSLGAFTTWENAAAISIAPAILSLALTRFKLSSVVSLACIGGHVGFSMIGFLTLPWVMTSELYPLRFRGSLGGITTSIVQMLTFATIKMYPNLQPIVGIEYFMWTFAVASSLGAAFALTILPETRGRSLDEIENGFSKKLATDPPADVQPIATISLRPNNITLEKFASIPEEKHRNITTNAYAFDNFCIDLTADHMQKNKRQTANDCEANRRHLVYNRPTISSEHVYF